MTEPGGLVRYERARLALRDARSVDEAAQIRNQAEAARAYAAQAKDTELETLAAEIKLRAERRVGELLREMAETGERDVGKGGDRKSQSPPATVKLDDLGVTKYQSSRWQKIATVPEDEFEAHLAKKRARGQPVSAEETTRILVKAKQAEARQAEELATISTVTTEAQRRFDTVCDLRVCRCADLLATVRPNVVVTDPPYERDFLPVYEELALACASARVPTVAVMCGQSYLPEVIALLAQHLRYRWMLAYLTPGGQAVQQWATKVNTFWKPVLLFGEPTEWIGDVTRSAPNDNDKRFHDWGQSESGMADLVDRVSRPGDLVCDPFLGGGTTGLVALGLGRRFVGCDVDGALLDRARQRILASVANRQT